MTMSSLTYIPGFSVIDKKRNGWRTIFRRTSDRMAETRCLFLAAIILSYIAKYDIFKEMPHEYRVDQYTPGFQNCIYASNAHIN